MDAGRHGQGAAGTGAEGDEVRARSMLEEASGTATELGMAKLARDAAGLVAGVSPATG